MIDCCLSYACSDIDGSVIADRSIPKWRRYILIGCMIVFGLSIVISLVFGVIFFIRLNPYYFYGKTKAKKVYFVTLAFSVICLISFFIFLALVCKIYKRQKSRCLFLSFNFFTWISVALAFICYVWGAESTKNPLENDPWHNERDHPCTAPLKDCYDGMMAKYEWNYEKKTKFQEWYYKLDINDVCGSVIVPILIVEIIFFVFYIVFSSFISGCCCCEPLGEVSNDSDEDTQSESNNNALDPNNPNMIPNQNNPNQYPNQGNPYQYPNQGNPNQYPNQGNPNQYPNQNYPYQYPNQYPSQIPNQLPNQNTQPQDTMQNAESKDGEQNPNPIQEMQNLDINTP